MHWFLYYIIFQVVIVLFFWILSKRKDKRYKIENRKPPEGFEPTEEVSIDPVSQDRIRVYVNPGTGERLYINENR
ncbi:hypothetical protein HPT25_22615 [Bacillus sp. BRMEA1]|uniref:hypothetical protein n=1 Tax=Neobacillus endophyticus TaxID=2738405 RepID=UPI001564D9DC|nr:hypothetical protein [Neobacillus endophyticus]NRD80135.1 hypothetical protein [Neobacillus endophyticus]